jgi:hypothetical protein
VHLVNAGAAAAVDITVRLDACTAPGHDAGTLLVAIGDLPVLLPGFDLVLRLEAPGGGYTPSPDIVDWNLLAITVAYRDRRNPDEQPLIEDPRVFRVKSGEPADGGYLRPRD